MIDTFLNSQTGWFTVPAVLGTFFFALRLALMLIGGGAHDAGGGGGDFSADIGTDVDMHFDIHGDIAAGADIGGADVDTHLDVNHADPGHSFQILSIQSIFAFLMGFGWGGLCGMLGTNWGVSMSIFFALVCGAGMVWLLAWLLKMVYDLESSGNIRLSSLLGEEGDVYVTIPPKGEGRGQVRVTVAQKQRIYNAVNDTDQPIKFKAQIKVTKVNHDRTLSVAPI